MMGSYKTIDDIDPEINNALELFSSRLKTRYGESIKQVILFGSYVRGEADEDSDVDILVITSDPSWRIKHEIIGMGYDIYPETRVLLSVKVMTERSFYEKSGFSFVKTVSHEGMIVA